MRGQEASKQLRQPSLKASAIGERNVNQSNIKSQGSKNQPNPFLSAGSKFKIDTTINGQKFLSFQVLSLSSIRKKQPLLGKLEKTEKKHSVKNNFINQNQQKQVQKVQQFKIFCEFCDKKTKISKLQTHLKSCNEAAFCKICQQYILKVTQKEHKYVCKQKNQKKVESEPSNFYDSISTILDRELRQRGINFAEKKKFEQKEIEKQSRLKSLKRYIYKQQNVEQTRFRLCIICCSQFSQDQSILQTCCGHSFHENCIKNWIDVKQRCPTCNQPVFKQKN